MTRRLVRSFRELADEFLERIAHLIVRYLVGMQIDPSELLSDEEQQLGAGQLVDLIVELELLENVPNLGREALNV